MSQGFNDIHWFNVCFDISMVTNLKGIPIFPVSVFVLRKHFEECALNFSFGFELQFVISYYTETR